MLTPAGLPGTRALAAHIREVLAEGQFAVLHAPCRGPARTWTERLIEALSRRDPETRSSAAHDLGFLPADSERPLDEIGERLGLGTALSAERLIEGEGATMGDARPSPPRSSNGAGTNRCTCPIRCSVS